GHALGFEPSDDGVMAAFLSVNPAASAALSVTPASSAPAAAAGLPAGDRAAIAPEGARSATAPSTSPVAAAPAARASDIAAAFVVSPPAMALPPAAITIGLARSALAAVLPPDGAILAAASPNGSQRLAPYALRPRTDSAGLAAVDSLFGGTAQRRSGEAPLALSAEALPAAGDHLPATVFDLPYFGGDEA